MGRPRTRWGSARRHLTLAAEGGELIPGAPPATFDTAPLPDGVAVKLWEKCGCSYVHAGPRKTDPAWTEWTEDPPREAGREAGKRALRYALYDPRRKSDGGLLGPNYYGLGHFHSGDPRLERPGMVDFLIWTPVDAPNEAWELKAMGRNPTLPQAHHMTSLEAGGFLVRTVRPCCLLCGDVDRWLAALSGKAPTLSEWAPDADLAAVRQRAAKVAIAGGGAVATLPAARTAARPSAARITVRVDEPPGRPVDEHQDDDEAAAYLIPMPYLTEHNGAQAELEGWLRDVGFPPYTVPWPMRIVVAGRLVVVWVNSGKPGTPRPRTWRSSYLDRPFPEDVVAQLGGETRPAPTMLAAMSLIEAGVPARSLPEESR